MSFSRLAVLAHRAMMQSPWGAAQKGWRYGWLLAEHWSRTWDRRQREANNRWSVAAATEFRASRQSVDSLLICRTGIEASAAFLAEHSAEMTALQAYRNDVLSDRVRVFDSLVQLPSWSELNWSADWRYGHSWPEAFYRCHDFYESNKPAPYDVKFPWELSRLNFLMVPTLLEVVHPPAASGWPQTLSSILQSWAEGNRTARSVNWYPMECAMRGVNLAQLGALLVHAGPASLGPLRRVLSLCELHGQFVYRTIEHAEGRGNHFAAELVALVLLGLLLRDSVPEAGRWLSYAQRHLDGEILAQFCEDGVHFEKSIPYHRLVTELFLLASVALQKAGLQVCPAASERLHRACQYVRAYLRPDGLAPLWGDSDDARPTSFDLRSHRDHRGLLTLGAVHFNDAALQPCAVPSILVPLFTGRQLTASFSPQQNPVDVPLHVENFRHGGMVCGRFGDSHFIADVGEVGMRGHGGHGHLDTLSFELTLDGVPLIIDPGSYNYTGDPSARNHFRSTQAHNVVQIDGHEMANLHADQMRRLGNEALPLTSDLTCGAMDLMLVAGHKGYERLSDPVHYQRTWHWDLNGNSLSIKDAFHALETHWIERFFHFAPGLELELSPSELHIRTANGRSFPLRGCSACRAKILADSVSLAYGQRNASQTLVLSGGIVGACDLSVEIAAIRDFSSPSIDPAEVHNVAAPGHFRGFLRHELALTPRIDRPTIPTAF